MHNTRERILEAAKELFSEKGFAAVTTKEISNKAQISEVTLFRHFDNKRNLFKQTIQYFMAPYKLDEFFTNEVVYDLEKDLKKLSKLMYEILSANAPLIRMMVKDKMQNSASWEKTEAKEHDMLNEMNNYFKILFERGQLKDDPEMAATFFINNINNYIMRNFIIGVSKDKEGYYEWLVQKTIDALK